MPSGADAWIFSWRAYQASAFSCSTAVAKFGSLFLVPLQVSPVYASPHSRLVGGVVRADIHLSAEDALGNRYLKGRKCNGSERLSRTVL